MLPKTFDPGPIEDRWYRFWETEGLFRPERADAQPFTICLPPPNVTGSLHMGHALNHTLQDVLIRWQRLKGRDARWIVGTDHAGIATQMVVERTIAAQGLDRRTMGRDAFVATVWDWKAQSGGAITRQMRRLGASCDWAHERFTLDPAYERAVTHAFVTLHAQGLIYRDKRLVNWDPKFQTAISDLEVETREVAGHFWHLRYPLADGSGHLVVATTRPETMLGDTAVAVHPDDPRHARLVGQRIAHPLTGRQIPVIADEWADPELGSGCVKITPAHDFNDWAVYERHRDIGWISILDPCARIADSADVPEPYRGLDRFEARSRIVADLEALGLVERVEPRVIQVPHGDRSGVVIEPFLTDQWYVDAPRLAAAARAAVEAGDTAFVPASWARTYYHWMDTIQPWCISRQLWWGHRIPAWYDEAGRIYVAPTEADAQAAAGPGVALRRDEDVLDTWFSSGLWPFATLGWPDKTADLARHLPGDMLVTAFDIIFFWVARMMMQGLAFTGEVPFRTVYCHGLVRDAAGQKMSKSKGNTVDPLGLVDRYGADALRMAMAASEAQGRDVRFDERRVEGYRNFATKLWNAARFAESQGVFEAARASGPPPATLAVNRWILSRLSAAIAEADAALEGLRFDLYAQGLYQFVWSDMCDWYLELAKPVLSGADAVAATETRAVAGHVLDTALILLHPLMPFITEELWHRSARERASPLIVASWPAGGPIDAEAEAEIGWLIALVSRIRSARTELNVPAGAMLPLHAPEADDALVRRLAAHAPALARLARVTAPEAGPPPGGGAARVLVEGITYVLPLGDVIDLSTERGRLSKALETAGRDAEALERRLASPEFLARARPEAVDKARADHAARTAEAERLRAALALLDG